MRTRWLRLSKVLLAAAIVAITVPTVSAQKSSKPIPQQTPIALDITIADIVTTGTTCPVLPSIGSDGIGSDGSGAYAHGDDGVSAYSEDDYGWGVNFFTDPPTRKRTASRKVVLGLCDTPVGAIVVEHVNAFLFKTSSDQTPTLRSMNTGDVTSRRLWIQWPRTKAAYRLMWYGDGNSGLVSVECTAASSGACMQWKVTPDGPAELGQFGPDGKFSSTDYIGNISFAMTLDVQ